MEVRSNICALPVARCSQKSLQRHAQAPFNLLYLMSPSSMGYICLPLSHYGKI